MVTLPSILTHDLAAKFAVGLKQAVQSEPAEVTVDANALKQFDSSALAVLLECRRQALAADKVFSVQGAPARLLELADLYGVAALIPSAPAVAV